MREIELKELKVTGIFTVDGATKYFALIAPDFRAETLSMTLRHALLRGSVALDISREEMDEVLRQFGEKFGDHTDEEV